MAATGTFSIIKPDAIRRNLTGAVTRMLEVAGLRVVASKRIRMSREQAEGFYGVHKERPFYNDLCTAADDRAGDSPDNILFLVAERLLDLDGLWREIEEVTCLHSAKLWLRVH